MHHHKRDSAHLTSYSPFDDSTIPLPLPVPVIESPAQPATVETNLGLVLTIANLMLTALLTIGMLVNGSAVQSALLIGGSYFAITTTAFVFVITGALTAMVNAWQRETTERLRVAAYRELGELGVEWRMSIEHTRQMELQGRRPSTDSVQRLSPLNTYVAPYADGVERAQVEGIRFAMGLYETTGRPDPRQVHPDGRLRGRMIGSKRGTGSRDAGIWLLRNGIVERVKGGYRLRIEQFPTRDSLRMYV